jgi:beta-galactosidase beta subunit
MLYTTAFTGLIIGAHKYYLDQQYLMNNTNKLDAALNMQTNIDKMKLISQ